MEKECRKCNEAFQITDWDKALLDKVSPVFNGVKYSIPEPTICAQCRAQEQMPWRAELHLFKRKCDLTQKVILSQYPENSPYTVYDKEAWESDAWDPLIYGRDYDFNQLFFDQFDDLLRRTPLPSRSVMNNENSDYINCASWCKNCYLLAGANHSEDCYYGNFVNYSENVIDCNFVDRCRVCYECVDCKDCYNLKYSTNCQNCSDSVFLYNCRNSKNCFGSVNLVGKEYIFMNKQLTQEQYEQQIKTLELHKYSRVEQAKNFFEEHRLKFPHKYMIGDMNENVTGNSIYNSRNCENCFDATYLEDCKNCSWFHYGKDCMDCISWGVPAVEQCYRCIEVGDSSSRVLFSSSIYNGSNIMYSYTCVKNNQDLFGCIGLKHKQFCILNKQYTEEEYHKLIPKIIEHMRSTRQWGKFFLISIAPYHYNKSIAQDYMPLNKEQALSIGAKWYDEPSSPSPTQGLNIADSINDVDQSICTQILTCELSGKPYKIIPQEYRFYKENNIPLPRLCFEERHKKRLARRNPRKLWRRNCQKCQKELETSFSPDQPEIIYCESCYLSEIY